MHALIIIKVSNNDFKDDGDQKEKMIDKSEVWKFATYCKEDLVAKVNEFYAGNAMYLQSGYYPPNVILAAFEKLCGDIGDHDQFLFGAPKGRLEHLHISNWGVHSFRPFFPLGGGVDDSEGVEIEDIVCSTAINGIGALVSINVLTFDDSLRYDFIYFQLIS